MAKTSFLYLSTVLAVLITGCNAIGTVTQDGSADTRIQITSEPSGATVYLMGKKTGVTPITVSERDIYPVSYAPETEKYYGKIMLRKEGCKEFSRRLTRSNVYEGLTAKLDCGTRAANEQVPDQLPEAQPPLAPAPAPARTPYPGDPAASSDVPAQQLEQLRTLQRLQEEGVLTDEEEENLRKRILNRP